MTKKTLLKKESAAESGTKEQCNTEILLGKILEACRSIKQSVDDLAERLGGGY